MQMNDLSKNIYITVRILIFLLLLFSSFCQINKIKMKLNVFFLVPIFFLIKNPSFNKHCYICYNDKFTGMKRDFEQDFQFSSFAH